MARLAREPLLRQKFYARMNDMKKPSHGAILVGNTFPVGAELKEKMMRGYARMRAAQEGVELETEHPLQARRFGRLSAEGK